MITSSSTKFKFLVLFVSMLTLSSCGGERQIKDKNTEINSSWQSSLNSSNLTASSTVVSYSSTSTASSSLLDVGSSGIYSSTVESRAAVHSSSAKTLSFSKAGPIYLAENDSFQNLANSGSSDSIIYTTSNPDVATVSENGTIQSVSRGTTIITATQGTISVSYSLAIVPKSVNFSTWENKNNIKIEIPSELNGSELYISNDQNCTFINYLGCLADQKYIVNGSTIETTRTNSTSKPLVLLDGKYWGLQVYGTSARLRTVRDHAVFVLNGKLWSFGGINFDSFIIQPYNDIWSTSDGVNWKRDDTKGLPYLSQHQFVEYNNKVWLFGGEEHIPPDNVIWGLKSSQPAVWSSTDGINWSQIAENTASFFCGETNLVSFKNKLWRFGGCNSSYAYSTTDGISWTQETSSPALLNRVNHRVVAFNNKLILIGGIVNEKYRNDIWSSEDGLSWTLVKEHAEFSERQKPNLIVFNNKLWLSSGEGNTKYFDAWSSTDGTTWLKEEDKSVNGPVILFKNELWTIAGDTKIQYTDIIGSDEIYKSSDGAKWWQLSKYAFDFTRAY